MRGTVASCRITHIEGIPYSLVAIKLKDTTVPCHPQFLKLNVSSLSCLFGNFFTGMGGDTGHTEIADFDCEVSRSNDDSERTVFLLLS